MFDKLYMPFLEETANGGIPWWVWVILILVLLVLLWFWFGKDEAIEETVSEKLVEPDDLKKIEGVGPKVERLLNESGIKTFDQIVDAGAEKLESILDAASLQMIDADTWPEQAKLAAAGEWDALEKLQDELKGGKKA